MLAFIWIITIGAYAIDKYVVPYIKWHPLVIITLVSILYIPIGMRAVIRYDHKQAIFKYADIHSELWDRFKTLNKSLQKLKLLQSETSNQSDGPFYYILSRPQYQSLPEDLRSEAKNGVIEFREGMNIAGQIRNPIITESETLKQLAQYCWELGSLF